MATRPKSITTYRSDDVSFIADQLAHHHYVELIGMKRVGINNLLRYIFDSHKFGETDRLMYIFIDLNNLVEREAFPFWQLTLKRISDAVRDLVTERELRREITTIFESAIQYQNLQMTYDGVREALSALSKHDIEPVIFFNRFDRVSGVMNDSFVDNIRGLNQAADNRLSCVFTSYRSLTDIYGGRVPFDNLYTRYILPAGHDDLMTLVGDFETKYKTQLAKPLVEQVIDLSGGHVHYLQMALITVHEKKISTCTTDELTQMLRADERIMLQSEEIWDSLSEHEQKCVRAVIEGHAVGADDKKRASYVFNVGIVKDHEGTPTIFSPLFEIPHHHRVVRSVSVVEFTKKEHVLFNLLKERLDEVCERDTIIEAVWPESAEYGITDWSIDKLVERMRDKIKRQELPYQLVTVRTRGYKLVSS